MREAGLTGAAGCGRVRVRASIEALHIPQVDGSGTLSVTSSFGVASLPESALDRTELIAAADAALYAAKGGGKNRVERAGMVMAEPSSRHR